MLLAKQGSESAEGLRFNYRHGWRFSRSMPQNFRDLSADGRAFEKLTGRSAVG